MIYRLEVLQKVNPAYKDRILYMLDLMLKDAQSGSLQEKLALLKRYNFHRDLHKCPTLRTILTIIHVESC